MVENFSSTSAIAALNILANTAANREGTFNNYKTRRSEKESDNDDESISPIFDPFFESGGNDAIISTTNLSIRDFHAIWDSIYDFLSRN